MTSKSTNGTPLSHISDEYLETICPQFTELFNSMTCYQQVHCLFCRLQKPQLKNLTTPIIGMTKLLGKNCADFYFNVNKDVVSTKQTRFNLTSLLLMTSYFLLLMLIIIQSLLHVFIIINIKNIKIPLIILSYIFTIIQ